VATAAAVVSTESGPQSPARVRVMFETPAVRGRRRAFSTPAVEHCDTVNLAPKAVGGVGGEEAEGGGCSTDARSAGSSPAGASSGSTRSQIGRALTKSARRRQRRDAAASGRGGGDASGAGTTGSMTSSVVDESSTASTTSGSGRGTRSAAQLARTARVGSLIAPPRKRALVSVDVPVDAFHARLVEEHERRRNGDGVS
jgi:hypothetical protein